MATRLGRAITYIGGLLPIKLFDPAITWSCETRNNLKSLYLHYHSAFGHQTWQTGDLSWVASSHAIPPSDYVVL